MNTRFLYSIAFVFSTLLIAAPGQAQTETVLYDFCSQPNCTDGSGPLASLTFDGAGNLYGTTYSGGAFGGGTVFELSPNGSGGWNESVLYSFCSATNCTDGSSPRSNLIFDSLGNIYGTTYSGGDGGDGNGTVFELSPSGGGWTETVLYNFCSQSGCADGGNPVNGLIMDTEDNLYGRTYGGGWTEQVIYNFSGGFNSSYAGLTMDANGNIFGVSGNTAFELSPDGNGWTATVIFPKFCSVFKDGCGPQDTPVLSAGNLYGTTQYGGKHCDRYGCGVVYELIPGKKGWTEKVLYSFKQGTKHEPNPSFPWAGVVLDEAGNIYGGTADFIYELVAVGGGSYQEKVLVYNTEAGTPFGNLIWDHAGNLYGTATDQYLYQGGVVFEVTP
jgi:uncharacterized repeat protein (TIGR03803 family)